MSTQYQNKGTSRDVTLEEWGINISKKRYCKSEELFSTYL